MAAISRYQDGIAHIVIFIQQSLYLLNKIIKQ